MSRTSFILVLLLGAGLSAAFAQEPLRKKEVTRSRAREEPAGGALRPLPPVTPESAPPPALTLPPGAMPTTRMPSTERPGQPQRPIDPRAPLVSVQLVMVEVSPEAEAKGAERQPPAPSGPASGTGSVTAVDLSAPDERILEELRKTGVHGRLEVLYRLQMTTVDQQSASLNLGLMQPSIRGVTLTQFGQTNNVEYVNTGLRVEIQPRVTGGTVAMTVNLNDSRLGRAEEGVPISIPAKGETIRAPVIQQVILQTTVNASNGQTIVLGGLAAEDGPRKRQLMLLVCPRIVSLSPSGSGRPAR